MTKNTWLTYAKTRLTDMSDKDLLVYYAEITHRVSMELNKRNEVDRLLLRTKELVQAELIARNI
jgi:hypothetical protein